MRIFEKPNTAFGWKCLICKTSEEKPVFLASKYGTQRNGNVEAGQFHVDCLDLWFFETERVLAMRFEK